MGPKPQLRGALDREVYQVIKKLEDSNNEGKPFKNIHTVYEAIQKSNSSLKRQKKRPLEDAIDRALLFRKEELGDSEDSEAELEEADNAIAEVEDGRFLLNRQMIKYWHDVPNSQASISNNDREDQAPEPARKKRRVQSDAEDKDVEKDGTMSGNDTVRPNGLDKEKAAPKKRTRHTVEHAGNQQTGILGGVADVEKKLFDDMYITLRQPYLYNTRKWQPVLGMLLSGPKGCGKKTLVRSVAAKLKVPLICLNPCFQDPERMEKSLAEAIDEAVLVAPSIILIERVEKHLSRGTQPHTEYENKALSCFQTHMKRLRSQPPDRHVLAMATTSDVTDIHDDMLGVDFFQTTLLMKLPGVYAREDIFRVITKGTAIAQDIDFSQLARMTHGFVGCDIKSAVILAQARAAHRELSLIPDYWDEVVAESTDDDEVKAISQDNAREDLVVTMEDLTVTVQEFTPSLRKEGFSVIPNVTWNQVGALQEAREQLTMSIIGPIRDPETYESWGISHSAGVLLWGPPGCGKTLIAQAVASEAQASFILINGPELLNKYVGESERAVRELFERARSSTPCILFFDEMDSLVPKRHGTSTEAGVRVVNTLLTELDGVKDRSGIYVIGTTNRPDMIDPAMLRPGRLSVRIFMDLPTPDERVDILTTLFISNRPQSSQSEISYLETVARDSRCKDFSGADLNGLRVKAAENGMRRFIKGQKNVKEIDTEDWEAALAVTKRSVLNPEMYRKLNENLGRDS